MLRVREQFHDSDVGRQRKGNEDSLFVRVPLFVVADGMGGAEAGEVASDIAVTSFADGIDDSAPARSLTEIVKRANRQINEQSRVDRQRAGMGTTLTAAYLSQGDEVVVAHVGDSRCYLFRDGDLVRLTQDHSLVGELVARGKLTEEQAESHPQRSVITRALGPEPDVEVDVDVFAAKDADVFLLCSDGLTSMIPESQVKEILAGASTLDEGGRELIAAANHAGGRDNITVILFRLEVAGSGGRGPARAGHGREHAAGGDQTGELPALAPDTGRTGETVALEAVVPAPLDESAPAGQGDAFSDSFPRASPASAVAAPRTVRPSRHPVEPSLRGPVEATPSRAKPPHRGRRPLKVLAVLLLVVLPLVASAWLASRAVYFIGSAPGDTRQVTIYRGVPYDLPGGLRLYERFYTSGVTVEMLPASRRDDLLDHKLRSREDAEDLITQVERGELNR